MVRMLERFWVNCGSGDLLCFTLLKLDYICQQLNIFSTRRERREEWMSKKLLFSASMTSTTFYLIKQSKFGWVEWRWNYEMNYWSVLYRTEEGTEIEIHPNWICVCVCVCVCVIRYMSNTSPPSWNLLSKSNRSLSLYSQIFVLYFSIKFHNPKKLLLNKLNSTKQKQPVRGR